MTPNLTSSAACSAECARLEKQCASIAGILNDAEQQLSRLVSEANRLSQAVTKLRPRIRSCDSIEAIKCAVADHFGLPVVLLQARERTERLVLPRHVAMYLCRVLLPNAGFITIGAAFERDQSDVRQAIRSVQDRLDTNPQLRARIADLRDQIQSKLNLKQP